MTSIAKKKNHKLTALAAIAVLAGLLVASSVSLHTVFAAQDVNVQTDINQKEYCKTNTPNSPISDLCIARFSNTIIQTGRSGDTNSERDTSTSTSTPTLTSTSIHTPTHTHTHTHTLNLTTARHPTLLTINIAPNPVVRGQVVTVSGLLLNTLSGSGVGGATIKFAGPPGKLVTSPDGSFSTSFTAAKAGRSTIQAHYTGAGIYQPSDSVKITLFVT
jgi:hypothetical protein